MHKLFIYTECYRNYNMLFVFVVKFHKRSKELLFDLHNLLFCTAEFGNHFCLTVYFVFENCKIRIWMLFYLNSVEVIRVKIKHGVYHQPALMSRQVWCNRICQGVKWRVIVH